MLAERRKVLQPGESFLLRLFLWLKATLLMLILAALDAAHRRGADDPDPASEVVRAEGMLDEAFAGLREEIDRRVEEDATRHYVQSLGREPDPNEAARLRLRIQQMTDRLAAAARDMEEEARGALREIARRRLEAVARGEQGLGRGVEEFRAELTERGIRVRDRAGRSQDPERYARMVLENGLRDLERTATIDDGYRQGAPGVLISDNEGPNSCETCRIANGECWSLSYYSANSSEHPSCVRTAELLPLDWEGELDRE